LVYLFFSPYSVSVSHCFSDLLLLHSFPTQRSSDLIPRGELPHSGILGSRPAGGSPRLIAACYALHRLLMPGHPPYTLSSLTKFAPDTHSLPRDLAKIYSIVKEQS